MVVNFLRIALTILDDGTAVSGFATRVPAVPARYRAPGPRQKNRALESREGCMLWGAWKLKRKFRLDN